MASPESRYPNVQNTMIPVSEVPTLRTGFMQVTPFSQPRQPQEGQGDPRSDQRRTRCICNTIPSRDPDECMSLGPHSRAKNTHILRNRSRSSAGTDGRVTLSTRSRCPWLISCLCGAPSQCFHPPDRYHGGVANEGVDRQRPGEMRTTRPKTATAGGRTPQKANSELRCAAVVNSQLSSQR